MQLQVSQQPYITQPKCPRSLLALCVKGKWKPAILSVHRSGQCYKPCPAKTTQVCIGCLTRRCSHCLCRLCMCNMNSSQLLTQSKEPWLCLTKSWDKVGYCKTPLDTVGHVSDNFVWLFIYWDSVTDQPYSYCNKDTTIMITACFPNSLIG